MPRKGFSFLCAIAITTATALLLAATTLKSVAGPELPREQQAYEASLLDIKAKLLSVDYGSANQIKTRLAEKEASDAQRAFKAPSKVTNWVCVVKRVGGWASTYDDHQPSYDEIGFQHDPKDLLVECGTKFPYAIFFHPTPDNIRVLSQLSAGETLRFSGTTAGPRFFVFGAPSDPDYAALWPLVVISQ